MENNTEKTMPDFQQEVLTLLTKVQTQQEAAHKAIFGNGHPGLIDQMAKLSTQMALLENKLMEQTQQTAQFLELLADHKLMQVSIEELRDKAKLLTDVGVRLNKLETDIILLKAKGGWWKDLLAIGLAVTAMLAQAAGYFLR